MPAGNLEKKQVYFEKLIKLLQRYNKVVIVHADHVGSHHMQTIRKNLRNHGDNVILMGKNTMIRRAIKGYLSQNPALESLLPHVKGNVGFVFTSGDLASVQKEIESNRVSAPARVGSISPCDVIVPKGPTGLDPQQTAFMQALNIATKINRGQVEISNDVHLLKPGDKVDSSKATLLTKLNIRPFSYGLSTLNIYDEGSVYSPKVLAMKPEDLIVFFLSAVKLVAQLSLATGVASEAGIPHYLANAYRDLLALSVETDYTFEGSRKIKELLSDPEAFARAQAEAAASSSAHEAPSSTSATAAAEPEPEPEEAKKDDDDDDGGGVGDLFGFGDD